MLNGHTRTALRLQLQLHAKLFVNLHLNPHPRLTFDCVAKTRIAGNRYGCQESHRDNSMCIASVKLINNCSFNIPLAVLHLCRTWLRQFARPFFLDVRRKRNMAGPMATVLAWPGSVRPGPFSRLYYAAFSRTHLSAVEPD